MKLETLREAKYVDPKWEQLQKFLTDNKPSEGYIIAWYEKQDKIEHIVNHINFERDEEGEFLAVTFADNDDWVNFTPKYFFNGVKVYKTKRVM